MSGVTGAIIGSTVVGAATSIGGGILGNKAAKTQADAALQASHEANQLQAAMYNQTRQDLAPWYSQGAGAVNQLGYLLGITPQELPASKVPSGTMTAGSPPPRPQMKSPRNSFMENEGFITPRMTPTNTNQVPRDIMLRPGEDFSKLAQTKTLDTQNGFGSLMHDFNAQDFQNNLDPGYQFRLDEGQKALERSAAARGNALGGSAIKAAERFGQDYGSNEFMNAYNRFQSNRATKYNQLAGLAGLGQTSANTLASAGTSYGNNAANILVNGANNAAAARASGYASTANAINGVGNSLSNYALLQAILNPQKGNI